MMMPSWGQDPGTSIVSATAKQGFIAHPTVLKPVCLVTNIKNTYMAFCLVIPTVGISLLRKNNNDGNVSKV